MDDVDMPCGHGVEVDGVGIDHSWVELLQLRHQRLQEFGVHGFPPAIPAILRPRVELPTLIATLKARLVHTAEVVHKRIRPLGAASGVTETSYGQVAVAGTAAETKGVIVGSASVQLSGNVATELKRSLDNPGHERVSFRLICNDRRRDSSGAWADGDEYAVTVVCWGQLAKGVSASVALGEPLHVAGRLVNRRYEVDGESRMLTEVRATAVGHDLSRGTSVFQRAAAGSGSVAPAEEPDRDLVDA
jgi:single-strand DNA-binding protein